METVTDLAVDVCPRHIRALELALLRQGVKHRGATHERCSRCGRTPLIGERVYLADGGPVLCELCRRGQGTHRLQSRVVKGPNYGRAIRVIVGPDT